MSKIYQRDTTNYVSMFFCNFAAMFLAVVFGSLLVALIGREYVKNQIINYTPPTYEKRK
jgi:hypothetical protein